MLLTSNNNSHVIAISAALFLHAALGAWATMSPSQIIFRQQAMQVSFVAPNANSSKTQEAQKKMVAIQEQKNSLKQKMATAEELKQEQQKSVGGKSTSGIVHENATATKSAQTEPVFDAAYLNNPSPSYPYEAKRRNIQGKVLVKVLVKDDGLPQSIAVAQSSGNDDLDEAAVDAVKQWKFVPAKKDNKSVQASVIVPIEFKII